MGKQKIEQEEEAHLRLKECREKVVRLSQVDMAKELNLPKSYYSEVENKKGSPNVKQITYYILHHLLKEYNINPAYIILGPPHPMTVSLKRVESSQSPDRISEADTEEAPPISGKPLEQMSEAELLKLQLDYKRKAKEIEDLLLGR